MGCDCITDLLDAPPEVKEILKTVGTECPGIVNSFVIKANEIDKGKAEILDERHTKVDEADKSKTDELEKLLLEYNKKEIDNEKELIVNEVDKIHSIYELGLELADKLKEITLKKFKDKLNNAAPIAKPAIEKSIAEINGYNSKQFLFSSYGAPLKSALEKQGMREDLLKDFIKKLEIDRNERRKKERNEFNIKKNEFPPEDELKFDVKDLYNAIFDEYQGEFKKQIADKFLGDISKNFKYL